MIIRDIYLSNYGYLRDNFAAGHVGLNYNGPFSLLTTANGSCMAIQAITLPRRACKGLPLKGYDPALIKAVSTDPWAAKAVPAARKNHKRRMRGLAKWDDEEILAVASEIGRVRGARWHTDFESPAGWDGGICSNASKQIDAMQWEIQRQWRSGQSLSINEVIRSGIAAYTAARLSKLVGGGLIHA